MSNNKFPAIRISFSQSKAKNTEGGIDSKLIVRNLLDILSCNRQNTLFIHFLIRISGLQIDTKFS